MSEYIKLNNLQGWEKSKELLATLRDTILIPMKEQCSKLREELSLEMGRQKDSPTEGREVTTRPTRP